MTLTRRHLKSVIHYDPETGIFVWRCRNYGPKYWNPKFAGKEAGFIHHTGYRVIRVDGPKYQAHRLAWLYMTGRWPKHEIDHKNMIRGDNRWENLREASRTQNRQNSKARGDNKNGFCGVYWIKRNKRWLAHIGINKTHVYLGCFGSAIEAARAYDAAAKLHHGEFARLNFPGD